MVGKKIAELCLSHNIDKVCFDRGGNIYHGRVQVCLPGFHFRGYASSVHAYQAVCTRRYVTRRCREICTRTRRIETQWCAQCNLQHNPF